MLQTCTALQRGLSSAHAAPIPIHSALLGLSAALRTSASTLRCTGSALLTDPTAPCSAAVSSVRTLVSCSQPFQQRALLFWPFGCSSSVVYAVLVSARLSRPAVQHFMSSHASTRRRASGAAELGSPLLACMLLQVLLLLQVLQDLDPDQLRIEASLLA